MIYKSSSSNHKTICSPLVVILCVLDIIRCVRNNGIVKVAAVQVVATGGSPFIPGKCKSEKVKVESESRDSSAALLHFKSNLHGSFVTINECCKIQDNFTKVQIVSVERLLLIQARPGKISLNLLGIPIFSSKTRRGTFPTV